MNFQRTPVLVVGDEMITFSTVVCLLQAGHRVTLFTADKAIALKTIDTHLSDVDANEKSVLDRDDFEIKDRLDERLHAGLAFLTTGEDLHEKRTIVHKVESIIPDEALIAINTESIPLSEIQMNAARPARIVGANWVEPVHTTFFLEVICNETTSSDLVDAFVSTARAYWQKDPYVLNNDNGIRARMISAMVREAFFLVENDYVSIEDIDRACRNDAGYYLPFAGHCRYMDLMGAYIYGAVMKDLNPELSKNTSVPAFFTRIVQEAAGGQNGRTGFYTYEPGELDRRMKEFRRFSYEIKAIISKYPFNDLNKLVHARNKAVSNI